MNLNRETLRLLQPQIMAALAPLAQQHKLVFSIHGGTFEPDQTNATLRLNIATTSETGEVLTKERSAFMECCTLYGFDKSDYGARFTLQGRQFTLCGLNPRADKSALIKRDDGRIFKARPNAVLLALGKPQLPSTEALSRCFPQS